MAEQEQSGVLSKKEGYDRLTVLRKQFTELTEYAIEMYSTPAVIADVMILRHYGTVELQRALERFQLFAIDNFDDFRLWVIQKRGADFPQSFYRQAGLLTEKGDFLLRNRYIVPIKDISGEVTAWVGWYPDTKKYITTPTFGFSKNAQFFNADNYRACWECNNGVTFLVEGIFDTIALTSLGFSALGNMGTDFSGVKAEMLKRYAKVIAIMDNDKAGDCTNMYSRYGSKGRVWILPRNHAVVELFYGVKDADDIVKGYDCMSELQQCIYKSGLVRL